MQTLQEIIQESSPEKLGLEEILIHPEFVGYIQGNMVQITAVLERTAVVHPLGLPRNKVLVKLDSILVPQVVWRAKSTTDQRIFRSHTRGRSTLN